jgi:membrane protease YdiL (CAAX protease family)
MNRPLSKVALFLALTLALSTVGWSLSLRAGENSPNALLYVILTMCCPGLAAIATRLVTQRNLRGMGWKPGRPSFLALGYAIPIAYALPVYAIVWVSGIGRFDPAQWVAGRTVSPAIELLLQASVGVLFGLVGATGEELGWRGLLVPELRKLASFRNTSLISGLIWGAWHLPLIVGASYHGQGTPLWYNMACFMVAVVGMATILARLRLSSGSIWPCALMHASHNVFVQSVLDKATLPTPLSNWLTGEFGAGMVVSIWILVWLTWRLQWRSETKDSLAGVHGQAA